MQIKIIDGSLIVIIASRLKNGSILKGKNLLPLLGFFFFFFLMYIVVTCCADTCTQSMPRCSKHDQFNELVSGQNSNCSSKHNINSHVFLLKTV